MTEKKIKTKDNAKIITKNLDMEINGFLVPIINIHDDFPDKEHFPQQVYLTVAKPDEIKGPHLHFKRWGLFTCIKGNAKIVVRTAEGYQEYYSGEDHNYRTIQVPAGIPAALINIGKEDCFILNMPSPAWNINDIDENEVNFDDYLHKNK